MSRQMAFQFTGAQLSAMIDKASALVGSVHSDNIEEALAEKFSGKEYHMARASLLVLIKCYDKNIDYKDVKNVIVWKNEKGEPGQIQIEFRGR